MKIRAFAQMLRGVCGYALDQRVDPLEVLELKFPLIFEGFEYEVVEDGALGEGVEALTIPSESRIILTESVYLGAMRGEGRHRLTIMHEIGHFLLHSSVELKAARINQDVKIPKFKCSEWQADCFAGEFLATPGALLKLGPRFDLTRQLGISRKALDYQTKMYKKDGLLPEDF